MNDLLHLQLSFRRRLTENQDKIGSWLTATETPGVAIYSHAYRGRLQETLAQNYPALARLLGDASFDEMASGYILEHTSSSYSLSHFCHHLPKFLSTHSHYRQQTYLAELAAFEWQLTNVFDVADTPVVGVEDMNDIPVESWPSLTVKLHTSVRWLTLWWNIGDIYPALKTHSAAPDLIKKQHQKHYLIWRQNYSPHYRLLDTQEWLALKTFEKHDFSKLCLTLSEIKETPDNAPLEAATYLKSWLAAGLIESVNQTH